MEEEARDKKRKFNTSYEIIQNFAEYAAISGIVYPFLAYQTHVGKVFWVLVRLHKV